MGVFSLQPKVVVPESLFQKFYFTRVGRDHLTDSEYWNSGCQDAFAFRDCLYGTVIAVADGSSSAFESKTGSCAAMRIILNVSEALLAENPLPTPEEFAVRLQEELLNRLRASITPLAGIGGDITPIVEQAYYFTLVIAVVTADWTAVFLCGDGYYAINGKMTKVDSRPGNFPDYLGYLLCNPVPQGFENVKLSVREILPTDKLESIFVGTDGIAPVVNKKPNSTFSIEQIWKDRLIDQNVITEQLTKLCGDRVELSVIQAGQKVEIEPKLTKGRFADDVTFIAMRKNFAGEMPQSWVDYRVQNQLTTRQLIAPTPLSTPTPKVATTVLPPFNPQPPVTLPSPQKLTWWEWIKDFFYRIAWEEFDDVKKQEPKTKRKDWK